MNQKSPKPRFAHGAWLLVVALFTFIGLFWHQTMAARLASHPTELSLGTCLPILLAIALAWRMVRAQTSYSPSFAITLACFLVLVIGAAELLMLITIAGLVL